MKTETSVLELQFKIYPAFPKANLMRVQGAGAKKFKYRVAGKMSEGEEKIKKRVTSY